MFGSVPGISLCGSIDLSLGLFHTVRDGYSLVLSLDA